MIKDRQFPIYRVPSDIRSAIESRIKKGISNKSFLDYSEPKQRKPVNDQVYNWNTSQFYNGGLQIQPDVPQIIWTYLSNGMESLTYGSTTNEEIADKISLAEKTVLAQRNCSRNYGFNSDIENCAFQTILYVLVSITDWLEIDEIHSDEIQTVYKIIYPRNLQGVFTPTKNKLLRKIISRAIEEKGLVPNKKALDLIATMMIDVEKRSNNLENNDSRRIMTRMMAFCQPV